VAISCRIVLRIPSWSSTIINFMVVVIILN
jgi:hypothetical protein